MCVWFLCSATSNGVLDCRSNACMDAPWPTRNFTRDTCCPRNATTCKGVFWTKISFFLAGKKHSYVGVYVCNWLIGSRMHGCAILYKVLQDNSCPGRATGLKNKKVRRKKTSTRMNSINGLGRGGKHVKYIIFINNYETFKICHFSFFLTPSKSIALTAAPACSKYSTILLRKVRAARCRGEAYNKEMEIN